MKCFWEAAMARFDWLDVCVSHGLSRSRAAVVISVRDDVMINLSDSPIGEQSSTEIERITRAQILHPEFKLRVAKNRSATT